MACIAAATWVGIRGRIRLGFQIYRARETGTSREDLPDYKEGTAIEKRGEFSPFTVDAEGHIKWTNRFTFLSHVSSVGTSTYAVQNGTPSIVINYSDNKRNPVVMNCTKEK